MPYYVHSQSTVLDLSVGPQSLELFTTWESRQDAVAHQRKCATTEDKLKITFYADSYERRYWRRREDERFDNGTYARVPWFQIETCALRDHKAHMSIVHPGLIAYTPDDEYGTQDRQLRIKPAKYLIQFAREHLTDAQIAEYVAAVRAFNGTLQIAESADDIERVYMHGPILSCMDRHHNYRQYTGGLHPVRVYGDSDLALAYLGTLDNATARSVIWPAKKIHTRIYGDATLRHVLETAGYRDGSLEGADVHAIAIDRGYLMPYIDATEHANLNGQWFTLTDDEDGTYGTRCTDGTAEEPEGDPEPEYSCERCERLHDNDDSNYCDRCERDRVCCNGCDTDTWDDTTVTVIGGYSYCDSCASERSSQCDRPDCSETFYQDNFPRQTRDDRRVRGVTDLCPDCGSVYRRCDDCDEYYPTDDDACLHCHVDTEDVETPRCEHTADLLAVVDTEVPSSTRATDLTDAFARGTWRTDAPVDTLCKIASCRASIAPGQLTLRSSSHDAWFYYCRSCVASHTTQHRHAPAIPRGNNPTMIGSEL